MERRLPAANMIWDHDHAILSDAEDFYTELGKRFDTDDWAAISELLAGSAPDGVEASKWSAIQHTVAIRRARRFWNFAGNGAIHGLL